jgi:magnesium chelatase family protein
LSVAEAIEVARLRSFLGGEVEALPTERPFRAPHHTVTPAGMVGAGARGWAGEAVLAHNGVLFLDELSEFDRATLDTLRQPLEDGVVTITRARTTTTCGTRFILLAATNPCPCGMSGERCTCSETELARHRRRVSGPLLERIDLIAYMRRPGGGASARPLTSSAEARERVLAARERQRSRAPSGEPYLNAVIAAGALRMHARLDERAASLLRMAADRGLLSARGTERVLRVARTIADLQESARVSDVHVGAAVALRPVAGAPAPTSRARNPRHTLRSLTAGA